MKKHLYVAAVAFLAACSGQIDPENDQPVVIPDEYTAPFTLSADKTQVEADGKEVVTFSLKDAYDREMLSDKKALQSINIVSDKGTRVPRMQMTATFISNGTYSFSATFKGEKSANTVEVEAVNRAKYEVFHRNVGLFKCTSVWCTACPGLARSLHNLDESAKEHSVVLAFHGNFNDVDPFSLYVGETDLGSYVMGYFRGSGWPTLVYDMNEASTGAASTTDIEADIMARRIASPATCGIKITSVAVEGTALKVKATMKSSTGGDYDLACAVLRNGLQFSGGYSANDDGIFDEVVVALSESFLSYFKGESVEKDGEISEEFSFDFGENVPSQADLDSYYVAVYAHRKTSDGSTMDNIVTCGYGESVDYHYND